MSKEERKVLLEFCSDYYETADYDENELRDYIDSQTAGLSEHITHADIGRWDGHHVHDEETEESYTLKEAVEQMSGCDDVQIYTEDGEVYLRGIHHDGENVYRWGHKMAAKVEKLLYGE